MYVVKLIKGLSYNGAVKVTKQAPFAYVDDKATADYLVSTGYFELVEVKEKADASAENATGNEADASAEATTDNETGETLAIDLSKLTVPELKEYAAERGISLEGLTKRAEILEALADNIDYGE